MRVGDIVARLGGDEFAVFAPGVNVTEATAIADRIVCAIDRPIWNNEVIYKTGAAIGISLAEARAVGTQTMEAADIAMYRAKRASHSSFTFNPEPMRTAA